MTNEMGGGGAKADRKIMLRLSIYPPDNLGLLNPHVTRGDEPEAHPSRTVGLLCRQMTDDGSRSRP